MLEVLVRLVCVKKVVILVCRVEDIFLLVLRDSI